MWVDWELPQRKMGCLLRNEGNFMLLNRCIIYSNTYNENNGIYPFTEINLTGYVATIGSQCYRFYEYLELHFWDNYRRGGKWHGKAVPTNGEYNQATQAALLYVGLSQTEATKYAELARQELEKHGFLMDYEIPIIPPYQPFIRREKK